MQAANFQRLFDGRQFEGNKKDPSAKEESLLVTSPGIEPGLQG
jgi:hypothetical protein